MPRSDVASHKGPPTALSHRWAAPLIFAMLTAVAIATAYLNQDKLCFYSDGTQYLSEVENFLAGRGFATSVPYYDEHFRSGRLPAVQTVHPPGFPLVAAVFCLISGLRPDQGLFLVALASYCLVPIVIFRIARELGHPILPSLAASLPWYAFAVIWFNLLAYMSEAVFTLFIAGGMLCTVRMRRSTAAAWPVLAGAAGALSFLIRYQGIFLIAALAACFFGRWAIVRGRRTLRDAALVLFLPAVAVGVLFVRNRIIAGSFQGGNVSHLTHPLAHVVANYYTAFSDLLGFDKHGVARARPGEMALILWGLGGLLWLLARRQGRGSTSRVWTAIRARAIDPAAALPWVYFGLTIVGLGYLEMVAPIDLSARMLIPLIPSLLLMAVEVIDGFAGGKPEFGTRLSSRVLGVLGILAFVLGQWNAYHQYNAYHRRTLDVSLAIREALHERIEPGSVELAELLHDAAGPAHPVLGSRAQVLFPILGRPILSPPPDEYSIRQWDATTVQRLAVRFDVEYVLCFPGLLNEKNAQDRFFRELRDREAPPWLEPIHRSRKVHLYRVRAATTSRGSSDPIGRRAGAMVATAGRLRMCE